MLDIRFLRENPEIVKQNIRNKFQDFKLPLVDEVIELDARSRAAITEASNLRAQKNALSKQIGGPRLLQFEGKSRYPNAQKTEDLTEKRLKIA